MLNEGIDEEDQGPRDRPAGTRRLVAALFVSLCIHITMLGTKFVLWPVERMQESRSNPLQISLQAQAPETIETTVDENPQEQPPEEKTPTEETKLAAEEVVAEEVVTPDESDEELPGPANEHDESDGSLAEPVEQLDFNRLLRETVEDIRNNDSDFRLGGSEPSIGDSAFDPRMRERLRQSEDINTKPPPKPSQIKSYQNADGSTYVEVGDGNCFQVELSLEIGAPRQWRRTRCRGERPRLELDPKLYSRIE